MESLLKILVSLCLLDAAPALAYVYTPKVDRQVHMHYNTVCAQDDEGMHCYDPFRSPRPTSTNSIIDAFTQGGFSASDCRIRENKLRCDRLVSGDYREIDLNDRQLHGRFCAIGEDGVRCWSKSDLNGFQWLKVPALSNARAVFVGNRQSCALDDSGLKCWGPQYGTAKDFPQSSRVPVPSQHVQTVDIGHDLTCAIYKVGEHTNLGCWDYYIEYRFDITNPRQVSVGPAEICAVGDREVRCWDKSNKPLFVPALKNPQAVSAGIHSACAIDDDGLVCWNTQLASRLIGYDTVQDTEFKAIRLDYKGARPTAANPQFNLDQIDQVLATLSKIGSPARAKYFVEINHFVKERLMSEARSPEINWARYLVAKLISPALLSMNSKYSQEILLPKYSKSMVRIEHELKLINMYNSLPLELNDIPPMPASSMTVGTALRLIVAAIHVLKDFAKPEEHQELAACLRPLGQAIAQPSAATVAVALAGIESRKATFESFAANPKSTFLVDAIYLAQEWLKR